MMMLVGVAKFIEAGRACCQQSSDYHHTMVVENPYFYVLFRVLFVNFCAKFANTRPRSAVIDV